MSQELLTLIAKNLVSEPDKVQVTETVADDGSVTLQLHVAPDDMGKVIGKQGRIARAIRTVIKAAGASDDARCVVEIV